MGPRERLASVPLPLWFVLVVFVLQCALAGVPGDDFELTRAGMVEGAFSLVLLGGLLAGSKLAWGLFTFDMAVFLAGGMASAIAGTSTWASDLIAVLAAATLGLLVLPSTRRYVHAGPRGRITLPRSAKATR
jgi:hypothetical protein